MAGSTKLSPDAFEAMMFGNAGRTGTSTDLNLAGSTFRVGAFTTAARELRHRRSAESLRRSASTGKYVVGNALGIAQDQGSAMTAERE